MDSLNLTRILMWDSRRCMIALENAVFRAIGIVDIAVDV